MQIQRRGVLTAAGGAIVATLAGCVSSGGTDEYNSAIELLNENADRFDDLEGESYFDDSVDEDAIHRRADRADEYLDEATAEADADLMNHVDNARAIADFQRHHATADVLLSEYYHCIDANTSLLDAGRFDDAIEKHGVCSSTLEDARDAIRATRAAHESIDPELTEEGQLSHDDFKSDINELESWLDILEEWMDALGHSISGLKSLTDAIDEYEDENWSTAKSKFDDARDEFTLAQNTLEDLEEDDDLPSELQSDTIEFHCITSNYQEAMGLLADSAAAADRGDWHAAEEYGDEAVEAMEAVDRC